MTPSRHKTRTATALAALVALFLCGERALAQATFQSAHSGDWTLASTWTRTSGTDADGLPDGDDTVLVRSGDTVVVASAGATCASLQAAAGSFIEINASGAFPAAGSYALNSASTALFDAAGNQTVRSGVIFGNLVLAGSGTKTVAPIPPDTTFISTGTLHLTGSGVKFDVSTSILHANFRGDVYVSTGCTLDASVGIVVVTFSGSEFVNDGTFLTSVTPGFGYTPLVTYNNTTVSGSSTSSYYDLVVNGTMSPGNAVTVIRHCTILAGGVFNGGSGLTHVIGGNWTNNGTFNCGTSTIRFDGPDTAVQSIGASTFYNAVLNNPKGATLAGTMTILDGGSLTLLRGSIATQANAVVITNSSPTALSLDTNTIVGTVTRAIASGSSSAYTFLSANASIKPSGTGNPGSITMTGYPSTNPPNLGPGADTNQIVRRYYALSFAGEQPSCRYTIRLPYLQKEVRGLEGFYALYGYGASGWADLAFAVRDSAANYVEQSGLISYSHMTIAEDGVPLPVQLSSFSATPVANTETVRLTWKTSSEINNYGFVVEQREGATATFEAVPGAFVPGHGTSATGFTYSWTVENLLPGVYYFRLRQIDLTGDIHLTEAQRVEVGNLTEVRNGSLARTFSLSQNYPNPFNPSTIIHFSVEHDGMAVLRVFNVLGQELTVLYAGEAQAGREYEVRFDAAQLPNGTYFYRLTSGEQTSMKKMILMK